MKKKHAISISQLFFNKSENRSVDSKCKHSCLLELNVYLKTYNSSKHYREQNKPLDKFILFSLK